MLDPQARKIIRATRGWALLLAAVLGSGAMATMGCDREQPAKPPQDEAKRAQPTLRIYAVSGAAGAIEPCGCVKDMLGGVDHAAAWIASQKKNAPASLVVGAGPMFFENPTVEEDHAEQAGFKAEAMAQSLADLGLIAWAPGANDWAMGVDKFSALSKQTGALVLAANLGKGAGPATATHLVSSGGVKVGLVGVSNPRFRGGQMDFPIEEAAPALKKGVESLKKQGAQILVALLAVPRGDALRLVETTPGLQLAVLGKPFDQGEANDRPFEPEVIGGTLVAQAPNHLQGLSVVDLFVRDGDHSFDDGSGLESLARRSSLDGRIRDLEKRIVEWKKPGSGISKKDVANREQELAALKKERTSIADPKVPKSGSYFLYDLTEVRESHGEDGQVASRLVAYYRKVNEYNKKAFADKKPSPVGEGESSYVGIDACTNCHAEERAFWDKTGHAGAYETLSSQHKEFNLDCVSCHVTGYEKPGGSTVTHVEKLTDVQCEVCHGPGSRHVENPVGPGLIKPQPSRSLCASACHHPPHVGSDWSVEKAWPHIIGKGHQKEKP